MSSSLSIYVVCVNLVYYRTSQYKRSLQKIKINKHHVFLNEFPNVDLDFAMANELGMQNGFLTTKIVLAKCQS